LDVVAALAARALPRSLAPAVDQARLDARTVLDRMRGRASSPVLEEQVPPIPLCFRVSLRSARVSFAATSTCYAID
jgi:hypothetical protein